MYIYPNTCILPENLLTGNSEADQTHKPTQSRNVNYSD